MTGKRGVGTRVSGTRSMLLGRNSESGRSRSFEGVPGALSIVGSASMRPVAISIEEDPSAFLEGLLRERLVGGEEAERHRHAAESDPHLVVGAVHPVGSLDRTLEIGDHRQVL